MKEERGARRVDVPLIVEYRPGGSSEWRPTTQGQNISQTGLCFRLSEQIPVGTEVVVRMGVVGHHLRVTATGRIAWIKEAGVVGPQPFQAGLQFTEVDPKAIQRLVREAYEYWREVLR